MQISFLFENARPQILGAGMGIDTPREARIMSQKLSCHPSTPGSPSWRRSRQAKQGRTQGVGVMERWALLRIDNTTTSATSSFSPCSLWCGIQADQQRTLMSGLVGVSAERRTAFARICFAGETTMAPNEEGSRLVRHQGKARAVDDD